MLPTPMIAANGGEPVVGSCIVAVNDMFVVPLPAVTEICVVETVPTTTGGFAGFAP